MSIQNPAGLTAGFRAFVLGLRDVVARYVDDTPTAGPLLALIIARLCRCEAKFAALVARVASGVFVSPRAASARAPSKCPPRARSPDPVPRSRGYLASLMKHDGIVYGRILAILLADPDMVALLEAAPQAGRLLRPLWRMLAKHPPPRVIQPAPRAPIATAAPGRAHDPASPDGPHERTGSYCAPMRAALRCGSAVPNVA